MTWFILSSISFVVITTYIVGGLRFGWHTPGNSRDVFFHKRESISSSQAIGYLAWIILFTIVWPLTVLLGSSIVFTIICVSIVEFITRSNAGGNLNKFGTKLGQLMTGGKHEKEI